MEDRQKGERTHKIWDQKKKKKSETNMSPSYGIDMFNLNVPSIWNTKISYVQMVIIYHSFSPSKCEKIWEKHLTEYPGPMVNIWWNIQWFWWPKIHITSKCSLGHLGKSIIFSMLETQITFWDMVVMLVYSLLYCQVFKFPFKPW